MVRLKVRQIRDGQHPSEVVVAFATEAGSEELIVDRDSLVNDLLEVGYPVGSQKDRLLVELPRETLRGQWRVWVPREEVVSEAAA